MGHRVKVLSDELVNRIAAGEVVERPASVVKELVENSIDAGASLVRVRVEEAGKRRIVVEDDGEGMSREDALLAIERHATSKLSSAEDLQTISTLGFRGEALPSIASVSRLCLTTLARGANEATRIRMEGGKVLSVEAAGAPRGTSVEVRDLFFNTPARLKFLKAEATELRNVVEMVTLLALVNCRVGFELWSAERLLLAAPSGLDLRARVADLVGREAPRGLYWKCFEAGARRLTLAFAAPHEGRSHRKGVRLFVNGRPVQDRLLYGGLMEGFRGYLDAGRTPLALLWVEVAPSDVDVNVHPAKREVRFQDEGGMFRWVAGCAGEALSEAPWAAGASYRVGVWTGCGIGTREEESLPGANAEVHRALSAAPGTHAREMTSDPSPRERVAEAIARYGAEAARRSEPADRPSRCGLRTELPFTPALRRPEGETLETSSSAGRFGALRRVGSFGATYLLFEDETTQELVVLDQHAAHEKILYEALLERAGEKRGSQPLLIPVTLECSPVEMAAFEERGAEIEELGFRVEPFGLQSLVLSQAPAGLPCGVAQTMLRDMLGNDELPPHAAGPRARREALAARAACAGAVKAGAALLADEVRELLGRLEGLDAPSHCPHGRPVLIRISQADLEKMFHRR